MTRVGLWQRLTGRGQEAKPLAGLYAAIVARAREPHWYLDGGVPDTIDGRFDTIAAVLAMVMLRIEGDPAGAEPAVALGERFVDDMDPQLREIGIGDIVVGKHIGRMMGMLGGRLGAYRNGVAAGDLKPALVRNLYRGDAPEPAELRHVDERLAALREALATVPLAELIEGRLP